MPANLDNMTRADTLCEGCLAVLHPGQVKARDRRSLPHCYSCAKKAIATCAVCGCVDRLADLVTLTATPTRRTFTCRECALKERIKGDA